MLSWDTILPCSHHIQKWFRKNLLNVSYKRSLQVYLRYYLLFRYGFKYFSLSGTPYSFKVYRVWVSMKVLSKQKFQRVVLLRLAITRLCRLEKAMTVVRRWTWTRQSNECNKKGEDTSLLPLPTPSSLSTMTGERKILQGLRIVIISIRCCAHRSQRIIKPISNLSS